MSITASLSIKSGNLTHKQRRINDSLTTQFKTDVNLTHKRHQINVKLTHSNPIIETEMCQTDIKLTSHIRTENVYSCKNRTLNNNVFTEYLEIKRRN